MIQVPAKAGEYRIVFSGDLSLREDATEDELRIAREMQDFSTVIKPGETRPPTFFVCRRIPRDVYHRIRHLGSRGDKHSAGLFEVAGLIVRAALRRVENLGDATVKFAHDDRVDATIATVDVLDLIGDHITGELFAQIYAQEETTRPK